MSSIASALNAAVSGLAVNRAGLEVASHNIGNANTEGYSRRVQHQQTLGVSGTGARGVGVSDVERVADEFVTGQIREQSSSFGKSEVRDRYLGQMQDMFGTLTSDSSLGQRLSDMMSAMEALGVEPESPTAQGGLIDEAAALARDLNDMSTEILAMRNKADIEIANAVEKINADLALVADLNEKIAAQTGPGMETQDPGDLQDQRDEALKRLSQILNIKTFERPNGEVAIFTGDARGLLDGDAQTLQYEPIGGSLSIVYNDIVLANGMSIQADVRSGELKGLLEVRDRLLPDLHRQIDSFTAHLRDAVNAAHNRGAGLPGADSLRGTREFADPATDQVTIGSDVRFVLSETSGLTAATFDLPAGVYTIDALAAAIDAGLGADGSAAVVNGDLMISATNPNHGVGIVDLNGGADAAITFDDGSGPEAFEGFSAFFGLNDFFVTGDLVQGGAVEGASTVIAVRADLIDNPERIARGRLSTGAAPVVGADRALAIGDGSNVQDIAAALSQDRSFDSAGGLPPITKPLADYAGEILGRQSQLKAEEDERLAFEEAMVEQFERRRSDFSGVSIDEELANILVLQNAFNASARIVTTADEMMEIITNMKR